MKTIAVTTFIALSLVACGGGSRTPVKNADIAAPESTETTVEPAADGAQAAGDEVILPEDPEAPIPADDGEETDGEGPVTPGKDLVMPGAFSAGTGAGVSASLAGTDDDHQTNLKMVRVRWKVTGEVEEAYVHAAFNRKALDGSDDDPCGKIDGRFLAVNDDGNDFNEGSADAQASVGYLTGTLCRNNADCAGMSVSPASAVQDLKAAASGGQTPQRLPSPEAPVCRIDLKPFLDQGVTEGTFATLSHRKDFRIVLVAKAANGGVVRDERTWTAPRPAFEKLSVSMVPDQGRVLFEADYRFGAYRPTLSHCDDKQVAFDLLDANGEGSYRATCRVSPGVSRPAILVPGVGAGNYARRSYGVQVSGGGLIVKDAGNARCDELGLSFKNCPGTLNLAAQTEPASYVLKNLGTGAVIGQGEMRLAGKVVLKARKVAMSGGKAVETWVKVAEGEIPAGEPRVTFPDVRRDHDHSAWKAELGTGSAKAVSSVLTLPYEMAFDSQNAPGGLPPGYGGNCEASVLQARVTWSGSHVRAIGTDAQGEHLEVSIEQPDLDHYGLQTGSVVVRTPGGEPREVTFWTVSTEGQIREEAFRVTLECP